MRISIHENAANEVNKQRLLSIKNLSKHFELYTQNHTRIPIFQNFSINFNAGECTVLVGPSGLGKSTLLKCLYGNYRIDEGAINIHFEDGIVDIASCSPQMIHGLRREVIGYVSQFLRVIPRVPTIELVAEPLISRGVSHKEAKQKAAELLERLSIPEKLWQLSPTTFSGGEQQRVNIARGFIADYPILLLDEPTASLDQRNTDVVIELIEEAKAKGAAVIGIFHDEQDRRKVASAIINLSDVVKDVATDLEKNVIKEGPK